MPWILLLLATLFTARFRPPHCPVSRPRPLNNPPAVNQTSRKKAAYAALADVLDNEAARKELIDQLRSAAATPPPASAPKLTPPEEKMNGRYWKTSPGEPRVR